MSKELKVEIDRAKWRSGGARGNKKYGETRMLNINTGRMCCLGHICNQSGVHEDKLSNVGTPESVNDTNVPDWMLAIPKDEDGVEHDHLELVNSPIVVRMIAINDHPAHNIGIIEDKLIELAKEVGIELSFKGVYDGEH